MNDLELLQKLQAYISRFYVKDIDFYRDYTDKALYPSVCQRTYSIWAAKELLKYVRKSKKSVLSAVEDFRDLMDEYLMDTHLMTKSSDGGIMFSIAYDVATDILDFCISQSY